MKLYLKRLHKQAIVPQYQTPGSACFDLHAILPELPSGTARLDPGTSRVFRTGWACEFAPGWAMLINSRSGHGFKKDVRLSNAQGIIDSDYRHEIMVKLRNDGTEPMYVNHGDRIAQAMIVEAPQVVIEVAEELNETERAGGFGSTGS